MPGEVVNLQDGIGRKDLLRIQDRYLALRDARLQRLRRVLTRDQRNFVQLLPLLFHLNHPMLPGYINNDTPAGIHNYEPDGDTLLLARAYARSLKKARREARRDSPIRALYLIGSLGTIGQDNDSDLDLWLCHNGRLSAEQMQLLQRKAAALENTARELGLSTYVFFMNAEDFRHGRSIGLSNESSGSMQHALLLEEFYRSGVLLAGAPPLWWLVPPEQEDNYQQYTRDLVTKRFIREVDWLDFGGLEVIPPGEFFSAAHWQLYKGISSPYKALLKLMLYETYAAKFPDSDWLSQQAKKYLYANKAPDADRLDPYRMMLERIESYLVGRNELQRLQLARRAFYFKSAPRLSLRQEATDWKSTLIIAMCEAWGWGRGELKLLDDRSRWKLPMVVDERNQLVAELSRSYRLLTDFARRNKGESGMDANELALLGRKLYAALDRRPGKIDCVNPGISQHIDENRLWLSPDSDGIWRVRLDADRSAPSYKSTQGLVEMLTWVYLNEIAHNNTHIYVSGHAGSDHEQEALRIVQVLRKHLAIRCNMSVDLERYRSAAHGLLSIAFINVGHDPMKRLSTSGYQLISDREDPFSLNGGATALLESVDHLYSNTWGEVRVERHSGGPESILDTLCDHLNLFWKAPVEMRSQPLHSFSFSSVRGQAIAQRATTLARAVSSHFHVNGRDAQFLLRLGEQFHLIEAGKQQFSHTCLGTETELFSYLGEPREVFRDLKVDEYALPELPLQQIFELVQPEQIQIFFYPSAKGITAYTVDEFGALYRQWLPDALEQHFLLQQQRFFDTVHSWRLLSITDGLPLDGGEVSFYRIDRHAGEWRVTPIEAPLHDALNFAELTLVSGPQGPWSGNFSLIAGTREFHSLQLGDGLYQTVMDYLQAQRRSGERYPAYLTGVVAADDQNGMPLPLMELLRFKGLVEQRLAAAL